MATNNGGNNNYQGSNPYALHDSGGLTAPVAIILSVFFTALLVRLIYFLLRLRKEREPDGTRGPSAGAGAPPRVRQPAAAVTVELQAGPMVCTYRRADGWREATCPVCLSDFADGEVVRVLPACMHYFHAACVDEWLRARTTCPLCRAAPAAIA